ncbi:hypothetical protein BGZ70_007048 [Mortierella alpina]|uniref:N-acetyltransferase domain-containing protein n=1 Tax=Mortierella alpina TaxID=64518 RepID=A0A9P6M665_MORAP|nr:hypothetical protein BGZ70_007048 [Mortierella alpina]
MVAIDKSAIRIRPYVEDDYDQVMDFLVQGFNTVGERILARTIKRPSTALSILTQSITYTLLIELALTALTNAPTSTGSSALSVENLRSLHETLMKPESVQDLILRFLKPSFLLLWCIVSLIVAGTTLARIYRKCVSSNRDYIQSCFNDDLQDIQGYYQSSMQDSTPPSDDQKKGNNKTSKKKNRSQFWVACLDSHPQVIMGCIALDDNYAHAAHLKKKHLAQGETAESFTMPRESDAELRRLSVHPDYRRLGISKILVEKLIEYAKEQGFKRVIMSTTMVQKEALVGYIRRGFEKERLITIDNVFNIWFGALDLTTTPPEKDKEIRSRKQQEWLREVAAY